MPVQPVGLFDSGVGGLTVARQVWQQLPHLSTLYFADTAHVPYGEHSPEELIAYADYITGFLISQGAALIIDACNSTSSVALEHLQQKYGVPVVGVVRPGVELAAATTRNRRIGVIATRATINAHAHRRALMQRNGHLEVFEQACPALVPLVERGQVAGPEARRCLEQYLVPLQAARIDTLILGCTHYPFFIPLIREILGEEVMLIDPAAATVQMVASIPGENENHAVLTGATVGRRFYVTGRPEEFLRVARLLVPGFDLDDLHGVEPPPDI